MARALARSISREADADDIVQEAFLALLTAWRADPGRFEGHGHARNYLLRTVRNLAATAAARPGARNQSLGFEPPDLASTPSPEVDQTRARQRALAEAIDQLPADDRELIKRRYLKRETLARISAELGVPISTLHSRERALLKRLQVLLAGRDPDAEELAS